MSDKTQSLVSSGVDMDVDSGIALQPELDGSSLSPKSQQSVVSAGSVCKPPHATTTNTSLSTKHVSSLSLLLPITSFPLVASFL